MPKAREVSRRHGWKQRYVNLCSVSTYESLHLNIWIASCIWPFLWSYTSISFPQIRDSGSPCLSFWLWSQRRSTDFLLLVSWTFWTSYKLVLSLLSPICFPSPSPTVATENERLSLSRNVWREESSLLMSRPSPSVSTRQSGKWDCPITSPLYHLTPIFPPELPARKRTYTKMYKDVCLEYIYMKHKRRKGKF